MKTTMGKLSTLAIELLDKIEVIEMAESFLRAFIDDCEDSHYLENCFLLFDDVVTVDCLMTELDYKLETLQNTLKILKKRI